MTRLRAVVHGDVQGVGFRWAARRRMGELGLNGEAENEADGTVSVRASGDRDTVLRLVSWLRTGQTPGWVSDVDVDLSEDTTA